ncbi:MAG: L-rhamnose mutarotase [Bacteroidetes bacterium]|nr:MAG: L-rhamnose mutarotase [Bacteroidota bacterium]
MRNVSARLSVSALPFFCFWTVFPKCLPSVVAFFVPNITQNFAKKLCFMKRYCFALDLRDDPEIMEAYERFHAPGNVWPEVLASIKDAGILDLEIYRTGNRLFMIMETEDDFDPAAKARADRENPRVQEWETLMWTFQKALPNAKPGEKWVEMKRIFDLKKA